MKELSAPVKIKANDGKELRKQECRVCDESGSVCFVLWEDDIGVKTTWLEWWFV